MTILYVLLIAGCCITVFFLAISGIIKEVRWSLDTTTSHSCDEHRGKEKPLSDLTYWIVGKYSGSGPNNSIAWEFQGVFSSEGKAVAACPTPMYFVGPAILDESVPDETISWPGTYYPQPLPKVTQQAIKDYEAGDYTTIEEAIEQLREDDA